MFNSAQYAHMFQLSRVLFLDKLLSFFSIQNGKYVIGDSLIIKNRIPSQYATMYVRGKKKKQNYIEAAFELPTEFELSLEKKNDKSIYIFQKIQWSGVPTAFSMLSQ